MSSKKKKLTKDELRKKDIQSVKEKQRQERIQEGQIGLPGGGRGRVVPSGKVYNRKKDKAKFEKEGALAPASISAGDCFLLDDGFFFVRHASEKFLHLDGPYEQIMTSQDKGPYGWALTLSSRLIKK